MKKLLTIALTSLCTFMSAQPALAQTTMSGSIESSPQSTAEYYQAAEQAFPISLTEEEKAVLATKCLNSQDVLSRLYSRVERRQETFQSIYSLIGVQFSALGKRLEANSIDASGVKNLTQSYNSELAPLDDQLTGYMTALRYAADVDCREQPATFLSLVENARSKRRDLANSIAELKDILRYDMTNSFTALRASLEREQ